MFSVDPARLAQPGVQHTDREYAFTSIWDVQAPIESVWAAIYDSERWPDWWPFVAAVQKLGPGDANGVGAAHRMTWTTRLPYRFAFESRVTQIDPPHVLAAVARGDLNGTGRWTLTPNATGTLVRYDWHVRTRAGWMNILAPIARPIFAWNHDVVMRSGARGLGRLLGARVSTGGVS